MRRSSTIASEPSPRPRRGFAPAPPGRTALGAQEVAEVEHQDVLLPALGARGVGGGTDVAEVSGPPCGRVSERRREHPLDGGGIGLGTRAASTLGSAERNAASHSAGLERACGWRKRTQPQSFLNELDSTPRWSGPSLLRQPARRQAGEGQQQHGDPGRCPRLTVLTPRREASEVIPVFPRRSQKPRCAPPSTQMDWPVTTTPARRQERHQRGQLLGTSQPPRGNLRRTFLVREPQLRHPAPSRGSPAAPRSP